MKKTYLYRITAFAVMAILLQSCFSAKNYQRPQVTTDNLYRGATPTDSSSIADISRDQFFTDPILQDYIKKGLQNNLDIRIAIQNIAAANAALKQGKAAYFPSLAVGTDWTHQELSKNSQFGALLADRSVDQYQLTGNVSWEADIWGKIRSNKRSANAAYLQTIAAQQAVQTQLVSDIASTYFQLLSLDAQLKVVDSTLGNRNKSVDVIRSLKDSGDVTEVGVKQTEAQLYQTQLIREDLKSNIVQLENAFSILLNQTPQTINRGTLENQNFPTAIKTGFPASLLRKRPDVVAAEYNLISNFELVNVARSNFYPSLKITATGGLQSVDIDQWFSANSLFANVVTGLTQPIFAQRQIRTRYEIAQSNREKAYLQFQQSLLNAGREVSDALQQYSNETTKLDIRAKQLSSLRSAAQYSDELLNYGMVDYLEVLTAKDQALNTELELIDNKYRQFDAIILLYKSLGGGWQ